MKLGIRTSNGDCNEFRDAVVSGILVGFVEMVSKLPESIPTLGDAWRAVRVGIIAGLTFYLANKGIQYKKNQGET